MENKTKKADELRNGEYVKLGGVWRGPVNMTEHNELCDSYIVHYPGGQYELNSPDQYVQFSSSKPKED